MRNLKKVLSLTLALVMMLGMMTFAGAAEAKKITAVDFKDMDKVVNKEAVTLLVDLGILNGVKAADGTYTFNPAGNIERGAYSKMIYAVMMASDNADVYKGVNTGLKDVKGHWAEGFIGYCVSTKIAAGNGNGTFTPNANITVVAGAKMLLTALGYDAKASGYENDALWSINIMRDAQAAGLMTGIKQAAGDTMTRDTAAQLIFNALFSKTVTPKFAYDMGVKYLDEYREGNALGVNSFNLAKVTGVVTAISAGSATITFDATTLSAYAPHVNNKLPATPEMVGSKVTAYVKTNGVDSTVVTGCYSTSLAVGGSVVLGVSTDGTAIADLYNKDKDGYIAKKDDAVLYFANGVNKTIGTNGTPAGVTYDYADLAALNTANVFVGTVVELLDNNDNGKADVVRITNKTVAKVSGDVKTKTADDGAVTVYVPGVCGTAATYVSATGYADLKKGDIVLFVSIGGKTFIEKAATVEGVVSASSATKGIRVDGTYYKNSALSGATNGWADYKNTYTFYLDNGKNIVRAVQLTAETTAQYVIVLDYAYVGATGVVGSGYGEAKVLHMDGTTEVVKVAKVDYNGTDTLKAAAPASNKDNENVTSAAGYIGQNDNGKIYDFTKDTDGKYNLTLVAGAKLVALTDGNVTGGKALFMAGNATALGDAKTVFVVATGTGLTDTDIKFASYTGISKLPDIASAKLWASNKGYAVVKDGIAQYVFIGTSALADAAVSDYIYVTSAAFTTVSDGTTTTYEFPAVVAGELTTILTNAATKTKIVSSGVGFYSSTKNDKGTLTDVTNIGAGATTAKVQTGIKSAGNGVFVTENAANAAEDNAYLYNDKTVVYVIDPTGSKVTVSTIAGDAIEVDLTDKVLVKPVTGEAELAEIVYIVKQNSAAKVLKSVTYTVNGVAAAAVTTGADATIASLAKSAKIVITEVLVSDGATYTVVPAEITLSATGSTSSTIKISVTPEDNSAAAEITMTFTTEA